MIYLVVYHSKNMGRIKIEIKNSIIKQPIKKYIPPEIIGVKFLIDFDVCNKKDFKTAEYLKSIIPSENNVVAANAVTTWVIFDKLLCLELYSPVKSVSDFLNSAPEPKGITKENIPRKTK